MVKFLIRRILLGHRDRVFRSAGRLHRHSLSADLLCGNAGAHAASPTSRARRDTRSCWRSSTRLYGMDKSILEGFFAWVGQCDAGAISAIPGCTAARLSPNSKTSSGIPSILNFITLDRGSGHLHSAGHSGGAEAILQNRLFRYGVRVVRAIDAFVLSGDAAEIYLFHQAGVAGSVRHRRPVL